jgi:hypothetical protein
VFFTAWNAVIFEDVLNDQRYLNEIRCVTAAKRRRPWPWSK